MGESYDDLECRIKVLPSIQIAVPNERCRTVYEALRPEIKEDENTVD